MKCLFIHPLEDADIDCFQTAITMSDFYLDVEISINNSIAWWKFFAYFRCVYNMSQFFICSGNHKLV